MKSLTLHPEWAHAVAHLGKRIENRSWKPPASIIGEHIAIHAGASVGGRPGRNATGEGLRRLVQTAARAGLWCAASIDDYGRVAVEGERVQTSAIIATARVVGAIGRDQRPETPPPWADPDADWWWLLEDVRLMPFAVGHKGRLGLWEVPRWTAPWEVTP
jgi:hypothetical protein